MSFWSELKRRNVFKVGAAYAIVAWLILQVAAITFPVLHLPVWSLTLVTVLLIIGFPLILLFAWAFEITPDGIKRTEHVPLAESITHLTGQKLNYIVTGLLVVAMVFVLFKVNTNDRDVIQSDKLPAESAKAPGASVVEAAPKTIAVLPFVDLSPEKDQEYFVDGLSEEILNSLAQIPGLTVIARTSSFSFKNNGKTVQEIADALGVENILEGSVRKAGNDLRITAQLIRAVDGAHLWSQTYDRELRGIFQVQQDIATAVTSELKVKLGVGGFIPKSGRTDNLEAYELYLVAMGQMQNARTLEDVKRILEKMDEVIDLDSEFALAWAVKSNAHSASANTLPANRVASAQDAALEAARKAIELEPDLVAAHYASSYSMLSKGDFIGAGHAYRRAVELAKEVSPVNEPGGLPLVYSLSGNFLMSKEILEKLRRNDPLNQTVRAFYMLSFALLGDAKRAEQEYERGCALFGESWIGDSFITVTRLGERDTVTRDRIICAGDPICNAVKVHLDSPKEGLAELRRFYSDNDGLSASNLMYLSVGAAYFGDIDFAMDVIEKAAGIDATPVINIWLPVMRDVRRTKRFKEFIREIGLVDYWNEFGWPDICRPIGDGDFECD